LQHAGNDSIDRGFPSNATSSNSAATGPSMKNLKISGYSISQRQPVSGDIQKARSHIISFFMIASLIWEELKEHIDPAEVDTYARSFGIARISRNEDAFSELTTLRQMQAALSETLASEIQRKNPPLLASPQRTSAIKRAIKFLDSIRAQGHVIEPTSPDDTTVLKYLRLTKASSRPSTAESPRPHREKSRGSARSLMDFKESLADIQNMLDDEYLQIQNAINALRCELFSTADELDDVRRIEPPLTTSIESFGKRLQTQEFVLRSMAKSSSTTVVGKARDSVRLNRLWP
jgi:hypothetical protein